MVLGRPSQVKSAAADGAGRRGAISARGDGDRPAMIRVSVLGASGYGAAEIFACLLGDPEIDLVCAASRDDVGRRLDQVHLGLGKIGAGAVIADRDPVDAARGADVVFCALPHRVSMGAVAALWPTGVRIIDLSGDFRLADPAAYARFYGAEHEAPELLARFVYGLPELHREAIAGARAVASPGCFATSQILALAPLARRGWLDAGARVVSVTGSSGSGARAQAGTHHPVRANNLKAYKPLTHQHTPEIVAALGALGRGPAPRLDFVPVSAPLTRGILTTALVDLPDGVSAEALQAAFEEDYAGEPFVRVLRDRLPEVVAVKGSQVAEVACAVEGGRAAVFCALDNLVKGGAGQAIQSFNLMTGRPEGAGLRSRAAWP